MDRRGYPIPFYGHCHGRVHGRGFGAPMGNGMGFGRVNPGGGMPFSGVVSGRPMGMPGQGAFGGQLYPFGIRARNLNLRPGMFGNPYFGAQGLGLSTGGVFEGNCPNIPQGEWCSQCGMPHYTHSKLESESESEPKSKKNSSAATKDIDIRGKSYAIRKSYLADNNKFEGTLAKYVDKRKESEVPDNVVQLLIDYLNDDYYDCDKLHDEVTLNILALNVGVNSVVEVSLSNVKKWTAPTLMTDFAMIVVTVLLSSKVDKRLREWLKEHIQQRDPLGDIIYLLNNPPYCFEHPELVPLLERLLFDPSPGSSGLGYGGLGQYRILSNS